MADPIITPPDLTVDPNSLQSDHGQTSIDQILSDTAQAEGSFFSNAEKVFSERGQSPAVTPPQPAQKTPATKAASAPAAKSPSAASVPEKPPSPSKVPGPPEARLKAPAQAPATDDVPRDFATGQIKAEHWKKLHSLRDAAAAETLQWKQKAEAAESKLKTANVDENFLGQHKALQEKAANLERVLESVAAERSPRFEQQFKPRIEAAVGLAKAAVGPELASRVESLLSMPDSEFRNSQLDEIANQLTGIRAGKFSNAVSEIDRVQAEKASLASRGSELWKQWNAEAQAAQVHQQEERRQSIIKTFDSELADWQGMDLLAERVDDMEHNNKVKERVELAKSIFSGGLDMKEVARASIWAAVGPDLASQNLTQAQRITELEQEIASLRGASPGITSDATSSGTGEPSEGELDYGEALARAAQREGYLR